MGVLFVCACEFALSCKEDTMSGAGKSVVVSWGAESSVLSAKSGGRTMKMRVGGGDRASVTGEFRSCSLQTCENVLCFRDFCAVSLND